MKLRLGILIVICLLVFSYTASARDVQWGAAKTHTLNWGEPIVKTGNYTIKLTDFDLDKGMVYIELEENGEKVAQAVLSKTDGWYEGTYLNYEDMIRVRATDVTKEDDWDTIGTTRYPAAKIAVQKRGYPNLRLSITGGTFDPDSTAKITAKVENTGSASLYDVNLYVDTAGFKVVEGDTSAYFDEIPKDSTRSITFKIRTNMPLTKTTYYLTGTATGYDYEDHEYHATKKQSFTVDGAMKLVVRKTIVDELSLGQTTNVNVQVQNTGLVRINNITITDTLSPNLALVDNQTRLSWETSLAPGDWKTYTYRVQPLRTGKVSLPPATAEWRWGDTVHRARSSNPTITVHGPHVIVNKDVNVSKEVLVGTPIRVTLRMQNSGDMPAQVSVYDSMPDGFTLRRGSTNYTGTIYPGKVYYYNYTMASDAQGTFDTPKPIVVIKDDKFKDCYSVYKPPSIAMVKPTATPTIERPEKAVGERSKEQVESWIRSQVEPMLTPGFEAPLAVLGLLCVAALARRQYRR